MKRFIDKRLKLADLQAAMNYAKPYTGFAHEPAFMSKTSRAPRAEGVKNKHPEEDLQIACCQYLRTQSRILFFSVPNHIYSKGDPKKVAFYISRQKRLGLLPGVSDLVILFKSKNGITTVCMAELKSTTGNLTPVQKCFMEACEDRGVYTGVVRSLDDLVKLLDVAGY